MTSYKQRFNRRYKQSLNASNSKANISRLTGISVDKLDKVWDKAFKYPATHGKTDLDRKMTNGAFAWIQVYKFALENRRK